MYIHINKIRIFNRYRYRYMYIYVYICIYAERETEKQRERAQTKTNRKEIWFDFHNKKNLKHLCYEIPNFTFNAKEK